MWSFPNYSGFCEKQRLRAWPADGLEGKCTQHKACRPEFDPWDPHDGRRTSDLRRGGAIEKDSKDLEAESLIGTILFSEIGTEIGSSALGIHMEATMMSAWPEFAIYDHKTAWKEH